MKGKAHSLTFLSAQNRLGEILVKGKMGGIMVAHVAKLLKFLSRYAP